MLSGKNENEISKIIDNLFSCFDKDANGSVEFGEFLVAYASTSNGDLAKRLEIVFMFYVKNASYFLLALDV
jgi:Ca2+-binding EF-hand superfamily protein